ncbi:MAG: yraL [Haloplasmataceae bacterium]|nr:yraL [Haloplasmataceae bacterium]
MNYKNGGDVLPPNLLRELQKYIQGELIYIPKENKERASWGEQSGTKKFLQDRNYEIFSLYKQGYCFKDLADKYCLSVDSIKKITIKFKKSF